MGDKEDMAKFLQLPVETYEMATKDVKDHKFRTELKDFIKGFERLKPIYDTLLKEKAKQPYSINLIESLHADENAHSSFLCRLLQYPGEKNTYPFVLLFVNNFIDKGEVISQKINECLQNKSSNLKIEAEKDRIDVQIYMDGVIGIIIENKINGAADQNEQLDRYRNIMKDRRIDHPYVIYLTWDGYKSIGENSLSAEMQNNMRETKHLVDLNYHFNILPWLKQHVLPTCPYRERQLIFALEQYIDYLEIRACCREQDQAVYKTVYQEFNKKYTEEK